MGYFIYLKNISIIFSICSQKESLVSYIYVNCFINFTLLFLFHLMIFCKWFLISYNEWPSHTEATYTHTNQHNKGVFVDWVFVQECEQLLQWVVQWTMLLSIMNELNYRGNGIYKERRTKPTPGNLRWILSCWWRIPWWWNIHVSISR